MKLKAEGDAYVEIANALGRTEAAIKVCSNILKVKATLSIDAGAAPPN